jgi:SAM-dependent methyltransferase
MITESYKLGLRLRIQWPGTRLKQIRKVLSAIRHPAYLPYWLSPIGFVRYREFAYAFSAIRRFQSNATSALDIGSPKLFPITLAATKPSCRVTSIDIIEPDVKEVAEAIRILNLGNLRAEKQDARKLPYRDAQFDLITSVSVFEHIAPPIGGELPAVKEVSRLLKPGGIAILTVPFALHHFVESSNGDVYERKWTGLEPNFYQRFYDFRTLEENIIVPSELQEVERLFIEERHPSRSPHRRYAKHVASKNWHQCVYGLLYPLLAKLLLSKPKPLAKCRKPYIACLTLRKPLKIGSAWFARHCPLS